MTLTASIPVYDLRTAILTGLRPISATVHVPADLIRHDRARYAAIRQLEVAQTTARAAIAKNLEPAGLTIPEGTLDWSLEREPHGDGYGLSVVWRPRR